MSNLFRFGVTNGMTGDLRAWTAAARRAEALGYSSFLLPDTLRTPAPLPMLTAAAAVTERLRVGTWVLADPLRNPRQLSWEVASIQALIGGRLEVGIGAGRPDAAAESLQLGVEFGTAGERIARLRRTIELLRTEVPDTSIMVAAAGPKLLALAGQLADIVAFGWAPDTGVDAARERIDLVRQAADGRAVELAAGLIAVGDAPQPWLARMGTDVRTLADAGAVTVLTGTTQQMVDELRRRRDLLGLSYLTVPASSVELVAPVVAELAGR